MRPWGNVSIVKCVTMPKLVPPPRNAKYKSGWLVSLAVTIVLFGRTTFPLH